MFRIFTLVLLTVVSFWAGCALWRTIQSDETKIRWMLEDAVQAFNDARPRSTVAPLADDWYDRTSGIHRDTLLQVVQAMAWQERGNKAGEFPWTLELLPEALVIVVEDERASVDFEALLSREGPNGVEPKWRFAVDATFEVGEDGWEITATEHETLEGARPR